MKVSGRTTLTAILALLVLPFSGCIRNRQESIPQPGSGQQPGPAGQEELPEPRKAYMTVRTGGTRYFYLVEEEGNDGISGHFYESGKDSSATRERFTATMKKRKVIVTTDAGTEKLKLRKLSAGPYEAPAFKPALTDLYRNPVYGVKVDRNVEYGRAEGYWCSLQGVEADLSRLFTSGYIKSFARRELTLDMDIYRPEGLEGPRPLIMFMHGGAFYIGNKEEPAFVDFCNEFASKGYVTASINYRLGFHVGKGEIERAGYAALQDAHAAMRYLVSRADELGIDKDRIYVAGSSAGSITALNLAFMAERDRPKSTHGGRKFFSKEDMGRIDSSGNEIRAGFHIKAVANMWGAVYSTDMIRDRGTDIVSFHGDADNVVPFAEGYPLSSLGEAISQAASEKMYGSSCIDEAAKEKGIRSKLYVFPGQGHALNTIGPDKMPNGNQKIIKEKMTEFFFNGMVPDQASIESLGNGSYKLSGTVSGIQWKADGGFILETDGAQVRVLWMDDAQSRRLSATGMYPNGAGFKMTMEI